MDKAELELVREDVYAYKIFKNLFGGDLTYFVPEGLYKNVMLPKLNFTNYARDGRYCAGRDYFEDKNFQGLFLKDLRLPKCVLHNANGIFYNEAFEKISKEEAGGLLRQYTRLVFKKSTENGHGEGIFPIGEEDFEHILDHKKDYIIQEVLQQHASLAYYNASSVNVIRITTLFWKGNVYILGGLLRIGPPGSFCDHTVSDGKGPLIIPIDEDGRLGSRAIDTEVWSRHGDVWGKKVLGFVLRYSEMKEMVKKEHLRYPNHGIIGWDLTLDKAANIVCIEYNVRCPGIMQSQYAMGAIFAQKSVDGNVLLDEILSEC